MVGFSVFIQASCNEIDVFYPFEGWNDEWEFGDWREDSDEVARRELIRRCLAVDTGDKDEVRCLIEIVADPSEGHLSTIACIASACSATIEVNREQIINPFAEKQEYEMPEPTDLIQGIIDSEFCFMKVWENSGCLVYRSDDDREFDVANLTWEKGRFLYQGDEFELTDATGSSSHCAFYIHGECVAV